MVYSQIAKPRQRNKRALLTTVSKPISLRRFLNMPKKEDGYKYELVNGTLEKSIYPMTTLELKYVSVIEDAFFKTQFFHRKGRMVAETKIVLSQNPDKVRIPDLAFFTKLQIESASDEIFPIPEFVVELISENDNTNKLERKILEYFSAGVKVIWVVLPEIKQVKVYTSPQQVKICFADNKFDAAPLIPDLQLTVNELFGATS